MAIWFIRRLLQAVLVVLAMTVIVFVALYAVGDPVKIMIDPDATQAEVARAIAYLGLDQPLWRQYLVFLKNALHGDLGQSFVYATSAMNLIWQRLPATLELAFFAVLLSIIFGLPLGIYAGLRPDSVFSRVVMAGSILGFSLPSFWVGLMFIMLFAVQLGWLPSGGRGPTVTVLGMHWSFLTLEGLKYMLLPALNLSLTNIAMVMRLSRAGTREVLQMDYVKFARAKGLSPARVVGVHVLKNMMIPVVTVIGLDLGSTIAFSVVTENVFAWPGTGKLIIESINVLDRPVIVAYLIFVVFLFVMINLLVDLAYVFLDPRVRQATSS